MRRGSHASADEEGGANPCPAASAFMLLGLREEEEDRCGDVAVVVRTGMVSPALV